MTTSDEERWIGELVAVLNQQIAVDTDTVPLPLAAEELLAWLRDPRSFQRIQHRDWQTVIVEYKESFRCSGPRLNTLLQPVHRVLMSCLDGLFTATDGKLALDERARADATTTVEKLLAATASHQAVITAWKDMVSEAQSTARRTDCIESRRQYWSSIIQLRSQRSEDVVLLCTEILTATAPAPHHQLDLLTHEQKHELAIDEQAPLRPFQKLALCEAVLTEPPRKGDCVVWLCVDNAHIGNMEVSHNNVAFYAAQLLGSVVGSASTRSALNFHPPELATPTEGLPTGSAIEWDDDPGIVYVRVALNAIETHLAVPQARAITATLIQLADPLPGTWNLLRGEIVYVDGRLVYRKAWHSKNTTPRRPHHVVDDIGQRLEEIGTTTTFADIVAVERVEVALALRSALNRARSAGPVEVVMTAVRALEHVSVWAGGEDWTEFLRARFRTAVSHVQLVTFVTAIMEAIETNPPSNELFAEHPQELLQLTCDLYRWNGEEDELIPLAAIGHAAAIRDIYAKHWLYRALAEVAAAFESGTTLKARLEANDRRFNHHLDRLRRVRNSAIHGGPITTGACETIAHFAFHLGRYCLDQALRAHLADDDVHHHLDQFAKDQARRRHIAITQQSYEQLFT
ncbi:hypothetical protein ACIBCD_34045 [Nocardia brasiliensis]|uniref:hypothetical protein n=1 Tax=Nocardia brasiliensis TaxID=37326 RepID=UPI0037A83914